jgi:hypothetical protein
LIFKREMTKWRLLETLRNITPMIKKKTDLWHVGIAHQPIASFLHQTQLPTVTWLPAPRSFAFIADPFGLYDDQGNLTVLVEALDYREKRGKIHYYTYDPAMQLIAKGCALEMPYHLSYPFILQEEGEIYMLPEAHQSGRLTLYRAVTFPHHWEDAQTLFSFPAIDASIISFQGRWWMFFALAGKDNRAMRELHIAYADTLTGEWRMHANNPVRIGLHSSRMGGTPFIHEHQLYLPMQNCTHTYGGGITLLRVDTLTTDAFEAEPVKDIASAMFFHPYQDGCHTLSSCGNKTLIDVKLEHLSYKRRLLDTQRRMRRLFSL